MAKVYYIRDWAVQLGPVYAETSFNHAPKGLDFINYGKWLVSAVQSSGRHEIVSVPTWDFNNMPPGEYEKVLKEYDIIVFSDVEAKNFQLPPQFFNRHLFGTKVLTFPDRIRLTVEAIRSGVRQESPKFEFPPPPHPLPQGERERVRGLSAQCVFGGKRCQRNTTS